MIDRICASRNHFRLQSLLCPDVNPWIYLIFLFSLDSQVQDLQQRRRCLIVNSPDLISSLGQYIDTGLLEKLDGGDIEQTKDKYESPVSEDMQMEGG